MTIIKHYQKRNLPFVYSNHNLFDIAIERVKGGNHGATVFIPHVCNNIDLFGAGFAAQVAEKFPIVKENYHMLGKNFLRNNLGYSQIVKVYEDAKFKHKLFFVNMIAQNGIRSTNNNRPLKYPALVKSMLTTANYIMAQTGFNNKTEKVEIHTPKFGSGLAGGNWHFITDLIEDIWGLFPVIVYNYPPQK